MGLKAINPLLKTIGQKLQYITPKVEAKNIKPFASNTKELIGDVCNLSKSIRIESFYEKLINSGLKQFNNPNLRQAFYEKIKTDGVAIDDLSKMIADLQTQNKEYPQIFINLTNPLKTEFLYNGVKLPRSLNFREAELVIKKNYTPQEILQFITQRERTINGKPISIEDADIIIKNHLREDSVERFLQIKKQYGLKSQESLYATFLDESKIQDFQKLIKEQCLSSEEAIFSILNKFTIKQNNTMKSSIKTYNMNTQEAALCTKLELNECKIKKFLELKNKKINYQNKDGKNVGYILLPEEAIYCTKYDFSETQIQRFAALKNQYFAQESVRNSGAETNYAVKDILNWVKKEASDYEIFLYTYFLNSPEKLNFQEPFHYVLGNRINMDFCGKIVELTNSLPKSSEKTYDKNLFLTCKKFIMSLPKETLSQEELAFIDKMEKVKYDKNIQNGSKMLTDISLFFDTKIRTPKQIQAYKELIKSNISPLDAEYIASDISLYNIIKQIKETTELDIAQIINLSNHINIKKFDIAPIINNYSDKWFKICTGEKEAVFKLFDSAKSTLEMRNNSITPNLTKGDISKIKNLGINKNSFYQNCLKLDEHNNLIFSNGHNSFKVAVQKINMEGKSIILVKDLENDGYYIAYDGAVTKLNRLPHPDQEKFHNSLLSFCKYSTKQEEIFANATKQFPIKIIEDDSKCIIGKGIKEFNIKSIDLLGKKNDAELVHYYQSALQTLKEKNAITVENILKIMPEFSNIQINPYTTSKNGKMLYSISAEWKSKEGIKWQLRTHSTDLEHYMNSKNSAENSDWIFRLGHEVDGEAKFFEFNETSNKFTDTGSFMGKSSHIQIPQSPFEEGNLLANVHFQNIMRQISANSIDNVISDLGKQLNIKNLKGNDLRQKIIEESFNNPLFYLNNKEQIDLLRSDLGLVFSY